MSENILNEHFHKNKLQEQIDDGIKCDLNKKKILRRDLGCRMQFKICVF